MLLVIDIGNMNIVFGVYKDDTLVNRWPLSRGKSGRVGWQEPEAIDEVDQLLTLKGLKILHEKKQGPAQVQVGGASFFQYDSFVTRWGGVLC